MDRVNLGLDNQELYAGCQVEEVAGRQTLVTPVSEAVNIVGANANAVAQRLAGAQAITLTGAMAVWAYLVVFHTLVHRVGEIWYDDGRGNRVLIAKH